MSSKKPKVNVRLNVRPLGSNWKAVKCVEDNDPNDVKDHGLDGNIWKNKNIQTASSKSTRCSKRSSKSELTVDSCLGLIPPCRCEKCRRVDDLSSAAEIRRQGSARRRRLSIPPPPPPPPSIATSSPPLVPNNSIEHNDPPNVQPAPISVKPEGMVKTMVRKIKRTVTTKISTTNMTPKVLDSITSASLIETEKPCAAPIPLPIHQPSSPKPIDSLMTGKEDSDEVEAEEEALQHIPKDEQKSPNIVYINHIPNNMIGEDQSQWRRFEEFFYTSEANMWLLILIRICAIMINIMISFPNVVEEISQENRKRRR